METYTKRFILNLILTKLKGLEMTTQELIDQLNAVSAQVAASSAKQDEAFAELSGFPAQVVALQKAIDELIAAQGQVITPEVQTALLSVQDQMTALTQKSEALANIVA